MVSFEFLYDDFEELLIIDVCNELIFVSSEKSAVSHCITWRKPISAKPHDISGAVAFAVSGQSTIHASTFLFILKSM